MNTLKQFRYITKSGKKGSCCMRATISEARKELKEHHGEEVIINIAVKVKN